MSRTGPRCERGSHPSEEPCDRGLGPGWEGLPACSQGAGHSGGAVTSFPAGTLRSPPPQDSVWGSLSTGKMQPKKNKKREEKGRKDRVPEGREEDVTGGRESEPKRPPGVPSRHGAPPFDWGLFSVPGACPDLSAWEQYPADGQTDGTGGTWAGCRPGTELP